MPRTIVPFYLGWDKQDFPKRITEQHFGQGISENELMFYPYWNRHVLRRDENSLKASGFSEMINDDEKFKVMLEVVHFSPDELSVKIVDNTIVVHGKHEEKCDEHGSVCREFTRRYFLPPNVDTQDVSSSLGTDGVLVIEVNKKPKAEPKVRSVSVTILNVPSVALNKQEEGDSN